MGKKIRAREARRRQHDNVVCAVLKSHSSGKACAPARAPACFDDFNHDYRRKVEALRGYALRPPTDWRCRHQEPVGGEALHRSRALLLRALSRAGASRAGLDRRRRRRRFRRPDHAPDRPDARRAGAPDLRRWYLIAAQGGSLYKQEAHPYLSKQESHHFLTAPDEIASLRQAMWYAVARAQTDGRDAALKVARSQDRRLFDRLVLVEGGRALLCAQPDDAPGNRTTSSISCSSPSRRTQPSRSRAARSRRCGGAWRTGTARCAAARRSAAAPGPAARCPTSTTRPASDHHRAIWRFRQIKTGNELFREGERMHHCVASYKFACMQGHDLDLVADLANSRSAGTTAA